MRYRRAIEKLQAFAAACESVKGWPPGNPFLLEAYVFGDVLQGADPLEYVEVVLVLNLPPQEVVWESNPHGTMWLADRLRLSKGGFAYWWRSHLDPVSNYHIRAPVRFWSQEGPDEGVIRALAERRLDDLPRQSAPARPAGATGGRARSGAQPLARCTRLLLGARLAPRASRIGPPPRASPVGGSPRIPHDAAESARLGRPSTTT